MEKLIGVNELSEYLGVAKQTIYGWVHTGYVPYIKFQNAVRFKRTEIDKWIEKRSNKGRSKVVV